MKLSLRIRLSAMMFLQFFIWGCWFVPLWRYLSEIGFDGTEIGSAYSTTGWAAMLSPIFVGMIADRFFATQKVLAFCHIIGGVILFRLASVTEPVPFFWTLLFYTLSYMPTLALTNSLCFDQIGDPKKDFPGLRVWGTLGWIASGLLIGYMPEGIFNLETIENTAIPIKIAACTSILMGLYCLTLPSTPPKVIGQKVTISDVLGLKALSLLKDPAFLIFVISSLLICIPLSFYYQSANGFLGEIGINNPAAKMTLGQMSEIFFMILMPFFFARLGLKKMLLTGMIFWVARYLLFAFGDGDRFVSMIYLGILFHGICYDFFFVAGQIYVDHKAPTDIRASAQGFIALVTLGVGMVIGNLINGWVTKYYTLQEPLQELKHHWLNIWLIPAVMAGCVVFFFALFFREKIEIED